MNEKRRPPFDHLGDAVDLDHALLELAHFLAGDHFTLDGAHSQLQSSLTRALGEGLDTSVEQIAAAVEQTDSMPASSATSASALPTSAACSARLPFNGF